MGGICCEKVEGCQWRNKYKQSPFNVGDVPENHSTE